MSPRVITHPRLDEPYKLYTDASDYAIGAILVQEDDNGIEMSIVTYCKDMMYLYY